MQFKQTVTLTGEEVCVEFDHLGSYFWIFNNKDSEIWVSLKPNINTIPDEQGVIDDAVSLSSAGSGVRLDDNHTPIRKMYLKGTGEAEVWLTSHKGCPRG